MLSTAGVGAAFGYRAGATYLLGLFVGTNLVAFAVISGIAGAALAVPWLRIALFVGSTAYLLYLAARIALAGSKIAFIEKASPPGFVGGLILQIMNPKAYAVNTSLFSGFAFWPESLPVEIALKLLITNLIWVPVHVAWLAAGVTVQRLQLAPRVQLAINVGMALAMLAVVALAVYAQIGA